MNHLMLTKRDALKRLGLGLWCSVCLILALSSGGCVTQNKSLSDLPAHEFTGYYASAPGQSWFHASEDAHGTALMWVTFTGQSVDQVQRARAAGQFLQGRRYFVRWRAVVTTSGEVGPRGPGWPALLVRELLEFHPAPATNVAK